MTEIERVKKAVRDEWGSRLCKLDDFAKRPCEYIIGEPCACLDVARAVIAAVDTYRDEEKRKNCQHPRRWGGGGADPGASYSYWHCQDCGASFDSRKPLNAEERK